jgi:hypothetical protein
MSGKNAAKYVVAAGASAVPKNQCSQALFSAESLSA